MTGTTEEHQTSLGHWRESRQNARARADTPEVVLMQSRALLT